MKVFISWSGAQSKRLGEALRDWLPGVLQLVKPYFTPADIEKGTRWAVEIAQELEASQVGILCITRDNIHSDWVLFEAGALSKSLDKAHVCPILFGIKSTDLAGPLKQFQATEFIKSDVHKLMAVINGRLGEAKLPPKTLDLVFEKWWPELEAQIHEILAEVDTAQEPPIRSERELIVEVLEITRALSKVSTRPAQVVSARAVLELINAFVELHDEQAARAGGYQDALDSMKKMAPSLNHISRRYRRQSAELDAASDRLSSLSFTADEPEEPDEPEEDIPF